MIKKLMSVGIILLLILSFSGCVETPSETKTIYVDDDGGKDFTNIQDAINLANNGDTIYVYSGVYYEQVLIDKTIDLIGENKDTVIIDGCEKETVVNISTNWVNISGFTIRNSSVIGIATEMAAGIYVSANHTTVSRNIITNNKGRGIFLTYSSGNTIDDNTIIDNNVTGIFLTDSCSNNTLSNNTIMNHYSAIVLYRHSNNNNTISDNTVINNTVMNHPFFPSICLYYGSSNNKIVRNVITNNTGGIAIMGSEESFHNYISDNIISDNNYSGIDLGYSSYSIVTRNTIKNNRYNGIDFGSGAYGPATYSIISENNIVGNEGTGVYIGLSGGNNNTIYRNNFIDNNQSANDSCTNSWDNGSVGNYWSDYVWIDENNDGIGDIPYDIPGGDNQDRYPIFREILDEENNGQPDFGDVIGSFDCPDSYPFGLTWDGSYLWNANNDKIYKLTTSGTVIKSFQGPGSIIEDGLTWDGSHLWSADSGNDTIYKMTTSGTVIDSFDAPGPMAAGLTWDGSYLWNADSANNKIYKLTTSGTIIKSFDSPSSSPYGLAWDGSYLWNTDNGVDKIYKMTTSGTVIDSFDSPGPTPNGLTWDGSYLWNADNSHNKIYKIDVSNME